MRKILLTLVVLAMTAAAARADMDRIDALLKHLDTALPATATLTLNDCVALALTFNPELLQKSADMRAVMGDRLVVQSRFKDHLDVVGEFGRDKGSLSKTYYPNLTPSLSSAGGVNVSSTSLSSVTDSLSALGGSIPGGISADQISQACQYADMASQFGVDLSPYCGSGRVGGRQAEQSIQDVLTLMQTLQSVSASTPQMTTTANDWALRWSRRLLEFGREASAVTTLRSNQQTALYNYQQKLRDVLSSVRSAFFISLLKQRQIAERAKLLAEYQKKYDRLQKRFEVAQDVPRIDVLTAELDVLNERQRINTLMTEWMQKKMELLQITGKPLTVRVDFKGEIEEFGYTLDEVIAMTKRNSYQVTYLRYQMGEQERVLKELEWDDRPSFNAKAGVEDRRSTLGLSLGNSNQSYALDAGLKTYPNVPVGPAASSLSARDNTNYTMSLSVTWLLADGSKRKGVTARQLEEMNKLKAQLQQEETTEELNARKAYADWLSALEQEKLQAETVAISKRRLDITRSLREYGKVQEFQVDNFRTQYFSDQDRLFRQQENVIAAQENLRKIMGTY